MVADPLSAVVLAGLILAGWEGDVFLHAQNRGLGYTNTTFRDAAVADDLTVTPMARLRRAGSDVDWQAEYGPRLFTRVSQPEPTVVVLHRAASVLRLRPGRAWQLSGDLSLNLGKVDYANASRDPQFVPEVPSTVPEQRTLRYADVRGSARLDLDMDLRWHGYASVQGGLLNEPLLLGRSAAGLALRQQEWLAAQVGADYRVSRRLQLGWQVEAGRRFFIPEPIYLTTSSLARMVWQASRESRWRLEAGGMVVQRTDSRQSDSPARVIGIGTLALESALPVQTGRRVRWQGSVSCSPYFDPLLATLDPRGAVSVSGGVPLSADLEIVAAGQWLWPLRIVGGEMAAVRPGQSRHVLLGDLAARYRVHANLSTEASVRTTTRWRRPDLPGQSRRYQDLALLLIISMGMGIFG